LSAKYVIGIALVFFYIYEEMSEEMAKFEYEEKRKKIYEKLFLSSVSSDE
jgi:hypothetical protein